MLSTKPSHDPNISANYLVCVTCGTQFPTTDRTALTTCFICDDPRQYTPKTGQSFTTLQDLVSGGSSNNNKEGGKTIYKNVFHPLPADPESFISIITEPKLAIGQRAILVRTPAGKNVLWDCLTLLDEDTIGRIRDLGGLAAIVISHPHYYSTHAEWARAFDCPVYLAAEDREWTTLSSPHQNFLTDTEFKVPLGASDSDGVTVLKLGGHFPGSLVLLYKARLLIADTLMTTPAGMGNWDVDALGAARDGGRPAGLNSYSFMWSIPNMIPLAPGEIEGMWRVLKRHRFVSTHGAFVGMDVVGKDEAEMSRRVLESMQIQIRYMGYGEHAFLNERLEQ